MKYSEGKGVFMQVEMPENTSKLVASVWAGYTLVKCV